MTSINFKVFVLTQPGFDPAGPGLDPVTFGFPNLPEQEVDTLLIQPHRLVYVYMCAFVHAYVHLYTHTYVHVCI